MRAFGSAGTRRHSLLASAALKTARDGGSNPPGAINISLIVTMKEKSLLLQLTGEMPLFKIVDFLVENKGMDFTKKDISEGSGIARASLFNYWPELEKRQIVKVTRKFGKTKLYTLNSGSAIVKKLLELEMTLISQAMDSEVVRKKVAVKA